MKVLIQSILKKLILVVCKLRGVTAPEGQLALLYLGHRKAVGGYWEEMGKLQYNFMIEQGLKPNHILMDIGCGSLRGGIHFINYLNEGNYLGMDKNKSWVEAGINQELGAAIFNTKKPEFVISEKFEFSKFSKKPDYAIAQSLFSHLSEDDIAFCLSRLRENVNIGCRLYCTFFESPDLKTDKRTSHSHRNFFYTKEQMIRLGEKNRWQAKYIGDWQHLYGQQMMQFLAI